MIIEVIQTEADLDSLEFEWNRLLENSAIRVPFLRHEYLQAWWNSRGGGEWPDASLYVVTARTSGGELSGIAPLFWTGQTSGEARLMLLGSVEISDFLDFICRPEDLPAFTESLFDHLSRGHGPAWQLLDFYNLLETSPTISELRSAADRRGWKFSTEILQPSPILSLPADWEGYLAQLRKKDRHEIRRKLRRAAQHTPPISWYLAQDEAELEEEMEALLRLMSYDPVKEIFLDRNMRAQIKAAIRAAFHNGWLQLAFIEVGGEKGAAYLNFDFADHIWVYNSGFNPKFKDLSLGWVLLAYLIESATQHQRQAFDFMRGDEDYKYRFGAVNRHVMRALIRC
jgi:CelD/BcsL family acetyltransferase involved in cellulose biosynthesis